MNLTDYKVRNFDDSRLAKYKRAINDARALAFAPKHAKNNIILRNKDYERKKLNTNRRSFILGSFAVVGASLLKSTEKAKASFLPNSVITVPNIATLKTIVAPNVVGTINVLGYYSPGDGGGGVFVSTSVNPGADNGGTIIWSNSPGNYYVRQFKGTVSVKWFGAKGDNTTDDYLAISNAASLGVPVFFDNGTYLCSSPVTFVTGSAFVGTNRVNCIIKATLNGVHLVQGVNINYASLRNITLSGTSPTAAPIYSVGGLPTDYTALATFVSSKDIHVENCGINTFNMGFTTYYSDVLHFIGNDVFNFNLIGVQASTTREWWVDSNDIHDCTQLGAVGSYAFTSTGADSPANNSSEFGWFCNNRVKNIPSWDGFMTHGAQRLILCNNVMDGVRIGFDISHYDTTDEIIISANTIKSTSLNTWGATAAAHGGIRFSTDAGSRQPTTKRVIITNNEIQNFYSIVLTPANSASVISLQDIDNCLFNNNIISGTTGATACAGVFIVGACGSININANNISGTFVSGLIRAVPTTTISSLIINSNICNQTNATDVCAYISGTGTVGKVTFTGNQTTSNVPLQIDPTITYSLVNSSYVLSNKLAYGGGLFPNLGTSSFNITVTGAKVGDITTVKYSNNTQGITIWGYVSSANTVSVTIQNFTGSSITLGSGKFIAYVETVY